MISYAQNQEDVVLNRLTKFVDCGHYVDVGAGHPIDHNVTYALYTKNWRGINIEPMAREADLLREIRPGDVTLQTAIGNFEGQVTLYEAPLVNRGSTTTNPEIAKSYEPNGDIFNEIETDICTLTSIFERYVVGDCHILKIDVEGTEHEVLQGFDLLRFRPWVIVIEATIPQTTVDNSHKWESILVDAGYMFTLFDGLNKFYVRSDLVEIVEVMSSPANVFDNWKSCEVNDLINQVMQLQEVMTEMHANYLVEAESFKKSFTEQAESFKKSFTEVETYVQSLIARAERAEAYAATLEQQLET